MIKNNIKYKPPDNLNIYLLIMAFGITKIFSIYNELSSWYYNITNSHNHKEDFYNLIILFQREY